MDKALLVGINAYPDPGPALRGCINDVNDMRDFVIKSCGIPAEDVVVLTDADATADHIRLGLKMLVDGLGPGDRILFHYSGHGAQLQDGDAASDCICPVDFDWSVPHAVTVADFHAAFARIPAGVTAIWVSDSCHSGDLERDLYRRGVPKMIRDRRAPGPRPKGIPIVHTFRGLVSAALPNVALLAGCASNQTSADAYIDGRYNGAMTYELLRVLRTNPSAPLTQVIADVDGDMAGDGYDQRPELSGPPTQTALRFLGVQPPTGSTPAPAYDPDAQDGECVPGQPDPTP